MPTGQDIVNGALIALGILEQGGTPSDSDSTDALAELNIQWSAWSIDEGLIYANITQRFPITQNYAQYTIGPGAAFNVQIPARVYRARFLIATAGAPTCSLDQGGTGYVVNDTGIVLGANGSLATYTVNTVDANGAVLTFTVVGGTGYVAGFGFATATAGAQPGAGTGFSVDITAVTAGGQRRIELEVVSGARYYSHKDLQASALTPDEVYPDYNPDPAGFARLYLFPVPNSAAAAMLELEMGVNFAAWTIEGEYNLPPGFQDALQYALAWRLLPRYGMAVAKETAELVSDLGAKGEARIRDANAKNRQLPAAAVQPAAAEPTPAGGQ